MKKFILLLFTLMIFSKNGSLDACTAFQLKSQDGAYVYCRSMEFGVDLKSNILIVPRDSHYEGTTPINQPGLKWKTKYGFVGMNQWIAPTFVSDGMNEKGLVVGMLYLPGYTEYEKFHDYQTERTVGAWELATYLLGTCASVEEAKSALNHIVVAQQEIPQIRFSLPLHYYIADDEGNVLIVEYIKGKRVEYTNPLGVLTNSPTFDWHLENLSNFVNLSPLNVPRLQTGKEGDKIRSFGQGSGLLGIPGDYTPPSRFVRAVFFSQWGISPKSADETALLGFHILNTFDIFLGIVRGDVSHSLSTELKNHMKINPENENESLEYTQWTVVHDRASLKTYIRSYDSLAIQMVDLRKIDFSKPGFQEIKMKQNFTIEDLSQKAEPLKSGA